MRANEKDEDINLMMEKIIEDVENNEGELEDK